MGYRHESTTAGVRHGLRGPPAVLRDPLFREVRNAGTARCHRRSPACQFGPARRPQSRHSSGQRLLQPTGQWRPQFPSTDPHHPPDGGRRCCRRGWGPRIRADGTSDRDGHRPGAGYRSGVGHSPGHRPLRRCRALLPHVYGGGLHRLFGAGLGRSRQRHGRRAKATTGLFRQSTHLLCAAGQEQPRSWTRQPAFLPTIRPAPNSMR